MAAPPPPGPCPEVSLAPLFAFKPKRKDKRAEKNIARSLDLLRRWQNSPESERALDVPVPFGGGEEFEELWLATLHPLREWLATAAAHAAVGLAKDYARFKESHGCLAYDDFVQFALRLLRDPALATRIRAQEFSVLLDEAQDTDPAQFAVLIGVAQPAGIPGLWLEGAGAPPPDGRFSMVGDPQQAIYERGDVGVYQSLHQRLISTGAAQELTFSVTMRCDEAVVAHVNQIFPALLHGQAGQARFVPLQARPEAQAGRVWRLPLPLRDASGEAPKKNERRPAEISALAQWLAQAGPEGVGVSDWSHLAILAPRRDWLGELAVALRKAGLKAQLHADDRAPGADPARTWLSALLGVLADPADAFEIAGVLREVFGISDDEIFHWCEPKGGQRSLQLGHASEKTLGNVAATLALLGRLYRSVAAQPLRDAVNLVVQATELRVRLASIHVSTETLDALLDQATLADARGDDLADFARALRSGPTEAAELVARAGEVQLLTTHKAKGLEWPVVMHFGLSLKPKFPTPSYPCWQPSESEPVPICLYDKFHAQAAGNRQNSWRSALDARRRANFERLLYVAATRPKHALILVDTSAPDVEEGSLADLLDIGVGGAAHSWWESLPISGKKFQPSEKAAVDFSASPLIANTSDWSAPSWPIETFLATALASAENFPRRIRPSSLARHNAAMPVERTEPDLLAPPDYPEEQLVPAPVVEYGNWWHGLMEDTPWAAGPTAWKEFWQSKCALAPDTVRAQAEMAMLLHSSLAGRLAKPGLEFAVEMPFVWPEPGGARAYDGCMDLTVWDQHASRWLIIDWKTDRVDGDGAAVLRQRYGPQVGIYAKALGAMTGAVVETLLYSTRTGVLVTL